MGKNNNKKSLKKFKKDFEVIKNVEQGQMFGRILINNGCNFKVLCNDGITRFGRLCNSMKRGPKILINSYIVLTLRDFETSNLHCDIIAYGDPPQHIINLLCDRNIRESEKSIFFDDTNDIFKEFVEQNNEIISIDRLRENLDWLDI
jgi:translation initiation factor IF-1